MTSMALFIYRENRLFIRRWSLCKWSRYWNMHILNLSTWFTVYKSSLWIYKKSVDAKNIWSLCLTNQSHPSSGSFKSIQNPSAELWTGSHDTDISRSRSHFPMSLQWSWGRTRRKSKPPGPLEVVLFVNVQGLSTGNLSFFFFILFGGNGETLCRS